MLKSRHVRCVIPPLDGFSEDLGISVKIPLRSARLKKISLHVDDEERTVRWVEFEFVRFRFNAQGPAHLPG